MFLTRAYTGLIHNNHKNFLCPYIFLHFKMAVYIVFLYSIVDYVYRKVILKCSSFTNKNLIFYSPVLKWCMFNGKKKKKKCLFDKQVQ